MRDTRFATVGACGARGFGHWVREGMLPGVVVGPALAVADVQLVAGVRLCGGGRAVDEAVAVRAVPPEQCLATPGCTVGVQGVLSTSSIVGERELGSRGGGLGNRAGPALHTPPRGWR